MVAGTAPPARTARLHVVGRRPVVGPGEAVREQRALQGDDRAAGAQRVGDLGGEDRAGGELGSGEAVGDAPCHHGGRTAVAEQGVRHEQFRHPGAPRRPRRRHRQRQRGLPLRQEEQDRRERGHGHHGRGAVRRGLPGDEEPEARQPGVPGLQGGLRAAEGEDRGRPGAPHALAGSRRARAAGRPTGRACGPRTPAWPPAAAAGGGRAAAAAPASGPGWSR